MHLHVIGLGGAGCRIADRFAAAYAERLSGTHAFDTDGDALDRLTAIPEDRRYRFGHGHGFGGDLQRGREVGRESVDELSRALDDGDPSSAEAFLLVVGLGGATGGGAAPALAADLGRLYDRPVYALGVLPGADEREGVDGTERPLAVKNAARTLDALGNAADAVIVFDNEAWLQPGEDLSTAADRLNDEAAMRAAALFGAGDGVRDGTVPQQVVDASDVARALGSDGAIATIGYGEQPVETDDGSRFGLGLFSGGEPDVDTSEAVSAVETAIRKSVRGKHTLEAPTGSADRALLVVGGPPVWLNREAISQGRSWLTDELDGGAIVGGDAPDPDGDAVFAVTVLSGVESDRIDEVRRSVEE